MNGHEWQPGEVVLIDGERALVQRLSSGSLYVEFAEYAKHGGRNLDSIVGRDIRPLVVIDPENREQMSQVESAVAEACGWIDVTVDSRITAFQQAFRNLADPKPRIEEPTGLGAVVEDAAGETWIRCGSDPNASWLAPSRTTVGSPPVVRMWGHLKAVRVLSEGVTE